MFISKGSTSNNGGVPFLLNLNSSRFILYKNLPRVNLFMPLKNSNISSLSQCLYACTLYYLDIKSLPRLNIYIPKDGVLQKLPTFLWLIIRPRK